ncbi:alpha/beta hydrolase [Azospirillum rugosum]|uniref:Enterochelin esterase-like enzyme n=1 Tax=Azospirillum rugosum TaxID=416170 RepID=A0ABS4SHV5_9PROT|nr:alpha/beta hydrolase-fold protein [Azospirillum rugosum]MBP2292156.1 enterochelin esterase-like enzyme [Azospirillum rugosum]MDQ0525708.1 enterochelin esterase-like enzyme [Azospirillum rugosum]
MPRIETIIRAVCTLFIILAAPVPAAEAAGVVQELSLPSRVLDRDYRYTIYLPDGYAEGCGTYPVVYLLHGSSGNERDWLDKANVKPVLDQLIAEKRIPPTVVVMPGHRGMWWVDGDGDKAETVFLTELLPEIEHRFRVYAERAGRSVGGLSAGGYATIRFAFTRPDLFAVGMALSPAIYSPLPPPNSAAVKDPAFMKNGAFDKDLWIRLNWQSLIDAYRAQPLRVPLYLNSGDRDRFDIAYHTAVLHRELLHLQPDATEFRVVQGDHEWRIWHETIGDALIYGLARMKAPSPGPAPAAAGKDGASCG